MKHLIITFAVVLSVAFSLQGCSGLFPDCQKENKKADECYVAAFAAMSQCTQRVATGQSGGSSGTECTGLFFGAIAFCTAQIPSVCRSSEE